MFGKHSSVNILLVFVLGTLLPLTLHADDAVREVKLLPLVLVEAPAPTPPIWRATKAGRTVLLLGTVEPVPADIQWRSSSLDRVLANAEAIVMPPNAKLKLGFFGRLDITVSATGKTSYPAGKTLADTLPAQVYRDVILANQQFNHGDPALIHYRPGFAAYMLRNAAMHTMHFSTESPVYDYLRMLGRHHDTRILKPIYSIKVDHPTDFVRQINGNSAADVACLSSLADLLAHRQDQIRSAALAWATGDVVGIRAADIRTFDICRTSMHPVQLLARYGVTDLPGHMRSAWIEAIADATSDHRLTVAALPMRLLVGPGSYLPALRLQGFAVSGPE